MFMRCHHMISLEKIVAILVFEDVSTFDTPNNHMMQNTRCVQSGSPRHGPSLSPNPYDVKLFTYLRTSRVSRSYQKSLFTRANALSVTKPKSELIMTMPETSGILY